MLFGILLTWFLLPCSSLPCSQCSPSYAASPGCAQGSRLRVQTPAQGTQPYYIRTQVLVLLNSFLSSDVLSLSLNCRKGTWAPREVAHQRWVPLRFLASPPFLQTSDCSTSASLFIPQWMQLVAHMSFVTERMSLFICSWNMRYLQAKCPVPQYFLLRKPSPQGVFSSHPRLHKIRLVTEPTCQGPLVSQALC